jgi:hypothetical protein
MKTFQQLIHCNADQNILAEVRQQFWRTIRHKSLFRVIERKNILTSSDICLM